MEKHSFLSPNTVNPRINRLRVQIVEFVDDSQPGWVKSEFEDSKGQRHALVDKVPIFSLESLNASSVFPTPGVVQCDVLERWQETDGRELVRVSTARPDCVESTDGLSEFVVLESQLSA